MIFPCSGVHFCDSMGILCARVFYGFGAVLFALGLAFTVTLLPILCCFGAAWLEIFQTENWTRFGIDFDEIPKLRNDVGVIIPGVTRPLAEVVPFAIAVLVALVVHESGHCFACQAYGVPIREFGFSIVSGIVPRVHVRADYSRLARLKFFDNIVIVAAGVWHNYVLCFVLPALSSLVFSILDRWIVSENVCGGATLVSLSTKTSLLPIGMTIARVNGELVANSDHFTSILSDPLHEVWKTTPFAYYHQSGSKSIFNVSETGEMFLELSYSTAAEIFANARVCDLHLHYESMPFVRYLPDCVITMLHAVPHSIRLFSAYLFEVSFSIALINTVPILQGSDGFRLIDIVVHHCFQKQHTGWVRDYFVFASISAAFALLFVR